MKQMSIFDGTVPYKITKPIRLIELFAGYGSQHLALKYLGANVESHCISEWAVKSIQAYKDLHFGDDNTDYSADLTFEQVVEWLAYKGISADYNKPMNAEQIMRMGEQKCRIIYNNIKATHNLVNIMQVHGEDLEITDTATYDYIMTYSFPCFTADSLVFTSNGYKPITEIQVGDMVLTHDNTYQKVVNVFDNGVKPTLKINAMAVDEINCTHNHKFYVRSMSRVGHKQERVFSSPFWKPACELTKKDYLGVAINQNSIIPKWDGINFTWADGRKTRHKNQLQSLMCYYDFWWIIGSYIGDGWCRKQGGIIISCSPKKLTALTEKLDNLFNYTIIKERTAYKVHIPIKELSAFVKQFGNRAIGKHLTDTIFDLPRELLKGFLDGYMSADGCKINGCNKLTSISRELIYGTAQCVAKVYRTPYRIYRTKRPKTTVIENRVVHQHDTYELVWKDEKRKQDKAFYEDGYIWFPIQKITENGNQKVYDIEVENCHSFTVQNTIVHNCQDLSTAGKCHGMEKGSGTRSGLLWEVERILDELANGGGCLPQMLLMENVPEVIGSKNIKSFSEWLHKLESLGYKCYYKCLNAKNYGIPQNRNRCFMVSILGDYDYDFPQEVPLSKKLSDLLEKKVDEKYFLSEKGIIGMQNTTYHSSTLEARTERDGVMPTLRARDYKGGKLVVEPIAYDEQNQYFRQDGCVGTLTTDGSSPKHNNRVVIPIE